MQLRNKRIVSINAVVVAVALCAFIAPMHRAWACAALTTPLEDARVEIAEESAIIVWDQARQIQHFIRRATFDTNARDIGFLVPTPSTPELAEADNDVFFALEKFIKPKVIYHERNYYDFTPLFVEPPAVGAVRDADLPSGATAGSASSPVTVVRRQIVSGYDAVVLAANDVAALNTWLKRNGYVSSPELMQWLAPYVARNWKITAFKIAAKSGTPGHVATSAVRMSFPTDRPFFPYREPKSQRSRNKTPSRLLRVFLFASQRMDGHLGDGNSQAAWAQTVPWAHPFDYDDQMWLESRSSQPVSLIKPGGWLTVFEDRSSPRPAVDDLYFTIAQVQERVVPPPVIRYRYNRVRVPADALLLALVTLAGVLWLIVPPLRSVLARKRADEEIEFRLVVPRPLAPACDEPQAQDQRPSASDGTNLR